MEEQLLTEADLADLVGWSVDWVRRQRRAGKGPEYIRLGAGNASIRYRRAAVEAWLDQHSTTRPSTANEEGKS